MTQPAPIHIEEEPIHEHFGLTYASYQVLPRTVLQSMPVWWQRAFVDLLRLADQAAADLPSPSYCVQTGEWKHPHDLDPKRLHRLGYRWAPGRKAILDANDDELDVTYNDQPVFDPSPDPLPHYQRGRTRVSLREIERPAWLPEQPEAE